MTHRSSRRVSVATLLSAMMLVSGVVTTAQSPAPSPASSLAPCEPMTEARSPLVDPGASMTQAFGNQNPAFSDPDPAYIGRFHPGEDWAYPAGSATSPVVAMGNGRVIAVEPIGIGGQGAIVVLEHVGPVTIPASAAGEPWSYPSESVDTILSAYQGIDPIPGLAVGDCVGGGAQIGVISPRCGAAVAPPCTDLPPALHLEVRLASTADPTLHSLDWSVVGPAVDSSAGYFLDPQAMVDDGLRDPSAFITSMAAPCPEPSPAASVSAAPCVTPEPAPTPTPTPEPTPTPKAIRQPMAALLAGVPESVRDTCRARTASLVTGTLAAVDCHPDSDQIKLMSYYLLRPADARFVFSSRMRQYDLETGADCAAGLPGIESKRATQSSGCFVDAKGRANLRFASRATCPGVYVGVLGTGGDIAALSSAYDETVGAPWQDPGSSLAACRSGGTGVSAPPAPTHVEFEVKMPTDLSLWEHSVPPFRLKVTWDSAVSADTTIEVWAVTTCPRRTRTFQERPCITRQTKLPSAIRKLIATAPAADGSVSWLVPGWEVPFGQVAQDNDDTYWAIVVRAVNAAGASRFVIAKHGVGEECFDCTA